ncbi:autotransporter outer membrane beta-barrel domain-containing protein [Yersinia bercovieri]|uniref:autotransporter outer membrane beta-barrel domain-containing protein n=1 Tax=Yersinia bercovieri TaxID=634 RepID=UPI0011AB3466|nr:autotransporter outer membrane beta-barrel domain-containing protein [Yersinia bercovieri]
MLKLNIITRCLLTTLIITIPPSVYAIECSDPSRKINDKTCSVTASAASGSIYGWRADGVDAYVSGYSVIVDPLSDSTVITNPIFGGFVHSNSSLSSNLSANNNAVIINNGIFNGVDAIYGGNAQVTYFVDTTVAANTDASTIFNEIIVNNGVFDKRIYGGFAETYIGGGANAIVTTVINNANAVKNMITINNGTFNESIYGGIAYNSTNVDDNTSVNMIISAMSNSVTINNGIFNGNIMGGQAYTETNSGGNNGSIAISANAIGNSITIINGSFDGHLYGGYITLDSMVSNPVVTAASATDNIITLLGTPTFNGTTSEIWGGYLNALSFTGAINKSDVFTGNTLNFAANPISLNKMGNFEFYNFYLNRDIAKGDTLIAVTNAVDIDNAEIAVKGISKYSELLQGDTVTLIDNVSGGELALNDMQQVTIGTAKLADIRVYRENSALKASLDSVTGVDAGFEVNPQTKAYLEGRLPGMLMINQGSDLIAGLEMAQLPTDDEGVALFGITSGSKNRYNTGSHIDMDGFALTTGITKNLGKLTVGGLFEAGWGSYDTYNDFTGLASVKGGGKVDYQGAGVLANYDFNDAIYVNGSVRAGRVSSDFSSNDFGAQGGIDSHYDSSSTYISGHVKAGYKQAITPKVKLDTHASILTTRLGSDSVTNSQGENLSFSALNSNRVNTGVTTTYQATSKMDVIGGLAWEYEFDGEAKGAIDGDNIISPSVKGSIGIADIGLRFIPSQEKNLSVDIKLAGFTGKREGVAGGLDVKYTF